jgi:phosphoribosylglycinamide formyltransferase-1
LFCFGSGTNAENIIKYFAAGVGNSGCRFTNNPTAKVIERAKNNKIRTEIFSKEELLKVKYYKIKINWTRFDRSCRVLLKFRKILLFHPNKIINIHPALLPKYGGKGMYGMNVHKAVVANKEKKQA